MSICLENDVLPSAGTVICDRGKGDSTTTLIAGLGGQGVSLASGVLAQAALLAGYDVRQSEIHGLSQRFGSVSSQVRIGTGLYSTHRGHGGVELLLALEGFEAFKQLPFLRRDGTALVNRLWLKPIAASAPAALPAVTRPAVHWDDPRIVWFAGSEVTRTNCPRSLNFYMLGVLSTRFEIDNKCWRGAIEAMTAKRGRDVNQEMFTRGQQTAIRLKKRQSL